MCSIYPQTHFKIIKDIKQFYFGNTSIGVETFNQMTNLLSDAWFVYDVVKTAKIQSKFGKTFFYVYLYIKFLATRKVNY